MEDNEIEKLLDEEIEIWSPEEGEKIIGTLKERRVGAGKFESTLYIIQKNDGTLVGVWGSTVIDSKLKDLQEGTKLGIKYLGISKGERGQYKNYKVVIDESCQQ